MNNQYKNYSGIGCPRLKASAYDVSNIRLELVKPRKRRIALTKLGIYFALGMVCLGVSYLIIWGW